MVRGPSWKVGLFFFLPARGSFNGCECLPMSSVDLERMLLDLGAIKESDIRLKKRSDSSDEERPATTKTIKSKPLVEDDDDDWD